MGGEWEIVYRLSSICGAMMGMDDLRHMSAITEYLAGLRLSRISREHLQGCIISGSILQRAEGYWI